MKLKRISLTHEADRDRSPVAPVSLTKGHSDITKPRPPFGRATIAEPAQSVFLCTVLLFLLAVRPLVGADAAIATTTSAPATATPTSVDASAAVPIVLERGPHHKIIQMPSAGTYTELADNLCYLTEDGTYADSQDLIELVDGGNGGAIARQGPNKIVFAANINTPGGSIDMLTSDNKRLISAVLGLGLFDAASRSSTMIASVKDSFGKLVSNNTLVYEDAFDGVTADIRYVYKKGVFEQDVILRALPANFSPKAFGMDPATSRLQLWTEFFDPPAPDIQTVILSQQLDPTLAATMKEPDFTDQVLNFGQTKIAEGGKAFSTDFDPLLHPEGAVPVGKSFEQVEGGRTCLIESVQYPAIEPLLQKLPTTALLAAPKDDQGQLASRRRTSGTRSGLLAQFAKPPQAKFNTTAKGRILLAKGAASRKPGVVWDYSILSTGTYNNYVFQSDRTTLISGPLTLNGATVIEGGTVIKFSKNVSAKISISGSFSTIACLTSAFRPGSLTASDDNSVGETVSGSSGSPTGYYASFGISWDFSSNDNGLSYLRICYAQTGINYFAPSSGHVLTHSKLINCQSAIADYYNTVTLRNVLAYNQPAYVAGSYFVAGSTSSSVIGENLTIDQVATLRTTTSTSLLLTNTLLVGVTSLAGYTAPPNIGTYVVTSGTVFQTVGGGSHYLADDTYRQHGVVTISSSLLSDLRQKTTFPPILITADFTSPTVLFPQAQRDTGAIAIDCGWHAEPLDYIWSGRSLSSSLLLTNGVAIGIGG